jgi:glucosamine kinase
MTAATRPPLFIGVDGGGTGCRARIQNTEGVVLGTGIAGPAALRLGVDRALAEVEKACRAALLEAGLSVAELEAMHALGCRALAAKARSKISCSGPILSVPSFT